jgi:outer membrane receptor protein involved in Fe transport
MSLQYIRGWEDEAYFLNEESPVRVGTDMTHLDAEENTLPFQIDYTRPLSNGRLESGGRLQRRWIPITYDVMRGTGSVIYPGLGDWSEWSEDIYAGYVNLVREGDRYGLEAGFRIEQTEVAYDLPPENIYYSNSDAYDYFEIYPSIGITYDLGPNNSFAAHFNRRVDRPGEPELRIFPKYDDPELLKVGNPYLRPQFTETFELSFEHLWTAGSAIVSAYTRDIDDPFTRVFAIDPTNTSYDIVNKIYQNVGSGSETGLELIFSQDIGASWELTGSINYYEKTIEADTVMLLFPVPRPFFVPYSSDDTWDLSLNNLIRLARGIELQVSYAYYGDRNIAQGTQQARSSFDLGLAMPVLDDNTELTVSIADLFNDFGLRQHIVGDGFEADYENYYETQVVSVGLKRKF